MKTIEKYVGITLLAVVCSVIFAACYSDEDDYGGDYRLEGYWQLTGDSNGALPQESDADFFFAANGTGTYSCYDEYGVWQDYPITWWADGTYLTVDTSWETWDYTYEVRGGWLYLYPDNSGYYLVFRAS